MSPQIRALEALGLNIGRNIIKIIEEIRALCHKHMHEKRHVEFNEKYDAFLKAEEPKLKELEGLWVKYIELAFKAKIDKKLTDVLHYTHLIKNTIMRYENLVYKAAKLACDAIGVFPDFKKKARELIKEAKKLDKIERKEIKVLKK